MPEQQASPAGDVLGAFVALGPVACKGAGTGPLAGLRFAAKDLFDVAGHTSSCGNPDWLAVHEPACQDAPAVAVLLRAGAALVGVTVMDELAYSLGAENIHQGTPPTRARRGGSVGAPPVARPRRWLAAPVTSPSVPTLAARCGCLMSALREPAVALVSRGPWRRFA